MAKECKKADDPSTSFLKWAAHAECWMYSIDVVDPIIDYLQAMYARGQDPRRCVKERAKMDEVVAALKIQEEIVDKMVRHTPFGAR